jgi:hypothetical protein
MLLGTEWRIGKSGMRAVGVGGRVREFGIKLLSSGTERQWWRAVQSDKILHMFPPTTAI